MSENLQRRIDDAVKDLAAKAYEVALSQIRDNREAIDKIVEVLMEKETIDGNTFREMLSQYTTIPDENLAAVIEEATPVMSTAFERIEL
jgi:cell division protease FtsH